MKDSTWSTARIASRFMKTGLYLSLLVVMVTHVGCASRSGVGWAKKAPPSALPPGATKDEILACLNSNFQKTEEHPVLTSWRSGSVRLKVEGVPVALPATIAAQAPSNFRLMVSNPLSGGHEVDIGSNSERFWIWSKDQPQVMTASHEDVALAMQELEMPIHIHPLWLMEVFGVVPLNGGEFELRRPAVADGTVELVSNSESPLGENVERVVKVNLVLGCVQEHSLRLPGGKVLARARLDHHTILPNGHQLPLKIKLEWPDAQMSMIMDIKNPEVNSPLLASNANVWKLPSHGTVVDIGQLARQHRPGQSPGRMSPAMNSKQSGASAVLASQPEDAEAAGKVQLTGSDDTDWAGSTARPSSTAKIPTRPTGLPEGASTSPAWFEAQPASSQRPIH